MAASISASVGWGVCCQQRGGRHDLARLAIAALRHIDRLPRHLHRMQPSGESPSMVVIGLPPRAHARHAGANRLAVQMHRARAAQAHAASVLGAGVVEYVPQHPQKRRVRRNIHRHSTLFTFSFSAMFAPHCWLRGRPIHGSKNLLEATSRDGKCGAQIAWSGTAHRRRGATSRSDLHPGIAVLGCPRSRFLRPGQSNYLRLRLKTTYRRPA